MSPGGWRARWIALRTLGSFVRVAGETSLGEPIVTTGSDRLVLRRGTDSFWVAGRCKKCGVETASIDLGAHALGCRGPVQPERREARRQPAQPAPQPRRAPVSSPPPVQPQRLPAAQPHWELPVRPTAAGPAASPKHRAPRRSRRSTMSANSRRLALVYAYAFSVLIAALIIVLAVVVILDWVDRSTPQGLH